ncbi:hypothetical protein BV25DRAFT_778396 [Artomyces pyxidatus]|uniref:Uncharacterized protein n=1 Tax=Artomyces pyxidatus TaxID=48021 RepID=A0ACB8SYV1_9AGAM|nr:hypothetical protein BV25DRAFT_778396 [Artomyces pyxidatus]
MKKVSKVGTAPNSQSYGDNSGANPCRNCKKKPSLARRAAIEKDSRGTQMTFGLCADCHRGFQKLFQDPRSPPRSLKTRKARTNAAGASAPRRSRKRGPQALSRELRALGIIEVAPNPDSDASPAKGTRSRGQHTHGSLRGGESGSAVRYVGAQVKKGRTKEGELDEAEERRRQARLGIQGLLKSLLRMNRRYNQNVMHLRFAF